MTSRLALFTTLVAMISVSTLVAIAPSASAATCGMKAAADGTVGPITCKGGGPNAAVRSALAKESPKVMALGKGATLAQVKTAVCADITKSHATNPMVSGALAWQTANYRWSTTYKTWFTKTIVEGPGCTM
jgi:hypothetical protein